MSPKFSILGMIGQPPWIQQNSPIAKGIFHFFQQASLDNLSLLKENKYSYFVTKKATHIRSIPLQIEEIGVPFGSNYTRDESWLDTDDISTLVKTGHQILKNDIKPAIFPASLPLTHFSLVMLAISSFGQTEANFDWTYRPNINN